MTLWARIAEAIATHGHCVLVSVRATKGSVPREAGARMLLTNKGFSGTIGGGALEWQALAEAQAMLGHGAAHKLVSYALGPDMGQCCGGWVELLIESFDGSSLAMAKTMAEQEADGSFTVTGRIAGLSGEEVFGETPRMVLLFGAGHVGQALVLALAPLPFVVTWVDERRNAFPKAMPQNVTPIAPENPVSLMANARPGSLAFIMSHSHALDLALCDAALRNVAIAHVGLIGSASKRARFEKRLAEAGVAATRIAQLICPIGVGGIDSKHPAAIAAATAAQILQLDAALAAEAASHTHGQRSS